MSDALAVADLIARADSGDRRALARLITMVEVAGASARAVTTALHPRSGRAAIVGITASYVLPRPRPKASQT